MEKPGTALRAHTEPPILPRACGTRAPGPAAAPAPTPSVVLQSAVTDRGRCHSCPIRAWRSALWAQHPRPPASPWTSSGPSRTTIPSAELRLGSVVGATVDSQRRDGQLRVDSKKWRLHRRRRGASGRVPRRRPPALGGMLSYGDGARAMPLCHWGRNIFSANSKTEGSGPRCSTAPGSRTTRNRLALVHDLWASTDGFNTDRQRRALPSVGYDSRFMRCRRKPARNGWRTDARMGDRPRPRSSGIDGLQDGIIEPKERKSGVWQRGSVALRCATHRTWISDSGIARSSTDVNGGARS